MEMHLSRAAGIPEMSGSLATFFFHHFKTKIMEKTIAMIERGKDGTWGVYIGSDNAPYGLLGDGNTLREAMDNFHDSYQEMGEYYREQGRKFTELVFVFKYDLASFLGYYIDIMSIEGLSRLTGIRPGQLRGYVTGRRKPGIKTIEKIQRRLHTFADELRGVRLN